VVHGPAGRFRGRGDHRTQQGISGGSLEKRVPVKTEGDEIDELAMTFNQMLDRIQTLVTEIRR